MSIFRVFSSESSGLPMLVTWERREAQQLRGGSGVRGGVEREEGWSSVGQRVSSGRVLVA